MVRLFLQIFVLFILLSQCQQKKVKKEFSFNKTTSSEKPKASTAIDLKSKGIGPIVLVELIDKIDLTSVNRGEELYREKCTACHKVGSTFIGPPPNGILKRRTPEWVMNMMLNPDEMIQKDSLAQALFMEFDGQMMTDQNLTEEEARDILEYFRILK